MTRAAVLRRAIRVIAAALVLAPVVVPSALAQDPLARFAASLPRTDGAIALRGLADRVEVERDALGVPVIRGRTMLDVIRVLGFVHAQERFFQMDSMRRFAGGRLSEIVGSSMLGMDRRHRGYRFQAVAQEILAGLPADVVRELEVYAEGVNAGLRAMKAPPPEFAILQAEPEPWSATDALLVQDTMFEALNFNAGKERQQGALVETLPPALVAFLTPIRTRFDAPLLIGADAPYVPMPIPGPEVVDLRSQSRAAASDLVRVTAPALGSNSWAVAGMHTTHGGAIVANDPHLAITAPGIWFRTQLVWDGGRVAGVSLPGVPGIAIGSTDRIAWGFTNTMGDFQDLVVVEVDPDDPGRYRTPDGYEAFEEIVESIPVRGGAPVRHVLRKTRWGVVTGADARGRPVVLKWTALHARMVNIGFTEMAVARSLEDAVAIARRWYGPSQNVVIADNEGRIAWVVSGYFPQRVGFDGRTPRSWAEAGVGWDGPMDERLRPVVIDPAGGLLQTANNRNVDVDRAAPLGFTWALGARASRIAERLRAQEKLSEDDLLDIQLDTRVRVLDFYRDLLLEITAEAGNGELFATARRVVNGWNGTTDVDQPAARILDAFRRALSSSVIAPLVEPCRGVDPGFRFHWFSGEETVRRLLEERPAHLVPPPAVDWSDFLAATLRDVLSRLAASDPDGLSATWGSVNRASIQHPLARVAPMFAAMLNMPDDPLPGHPLAVRVANPAYGASVRMVVSPSHLDRGLLHIPAGQSGHPLSPHYRDSHPAWLAGRPTLLLAGAAESTLIFSPE